MFSYVLFAALVVAARTGPVELNFIPQDSRINGGDNTVIEEYPYQVSVQHNGSHRCGGSILSEHWILTAGHCFKSSNISEWSVRAGTSERGIGGTIYTVDRLVIHEKFAGDNQNDIALIHVKEKIVYDSTKQPVTLYSSGEKSHDGEDSVVTGWGKTEQGIGSRILQTVTLPIVDHDLCNLLYSYHYGGVPVGQICAGLYQIGGKDACQGDSGGPLTINGRQAGIVSWGGGCAKPQYPGVYTEVAYYRKWIEEHMTESF